MAWPLVSDFSRMLQNPRIAFRDPELQQCAIEKNALGQPKPRSGNFATVYRGLRPDGSSLALRVFNRRSEQRRQRYEAVSDYLAGREVPSFVGFVYDEQGIRSGADGKLYPLVRMDWVPGVTLFEWARDACRAQRSADLAKGAEAWAELARGLAAHHVAHGDLQPGNVMVDEAGRFTLVDYDCLAVPTLMGQTNLEMGLPAYQHPGRTANTTLFPGLDNFSALVIYVALRALAAEPSLWETFVDSPGYDGLLFRGDDFSSPRASPLRARLLESSDEQVRDLAHYLFELLRYDLQNIPCIEDVLLWCQSLDEVLARRDWDLAVKLVECMSAAETIRGDLVPLVGEAYCHVAGRRALEDDLRSDGAQSDGDERVRGEGPQPSIAEQHEAPELKPSEADGEQAPTFAADAQLVAAWRAGLKAGRPRDPAVHQQVDLARARVRRLKTLNELASIVTLDGERDLIRRAAQLPPEYHPKLGPRIKLAVKRVAAWDQLLAALEEPTGEAAIVAAAEACQHTGADRFFTDPVRDRVQLAGKRAALLGELEAAGSLPDDARDRRLLELWDDPLLAGCFEADRWRLLYERARRQTPGEGGRLRPEEKERA